MFSLAEDFRQAVPQALCRPVFVNQFFAGFLMKRLALFSFYNKSGRVNSFIFYYLEALSKIAETVFIVNGSLLPQSRARLEARGYEIYQRDNKGFDFGAWKDFLLSKESAFFSQYDELILCNSSCYGPVYPFSVLFDEMDGRVCDFWGLYRHPGIKDGRHSLPLHIQSYFLVLRKRMFHDPCLRKYFSELRYAASWGEAVKHEVAFTGYFEERGFASSSYLGSVFSEYIENPTIFMPVELLRQKFPFIKRKCFTTEYSYINKISSALQIRELLEYLRNSTEYPLDLIYDDLIESQPNSHLIKVLGLSFVLDGRSDSAQQAESLGNIAAVLYSSKAERIGTDIRYLNHLPDGSRVFIVVSSEKMMDEWQSLLGLLACYKAEVRLQKKGGAETAYWMTCRDVVISFDFICLLNDVGCRSSNPPIRDKFFSEHCFSSLLLSKEYVLNLLRLFMNNQRLGLLMPFVPMFAEWPQRILNEEWGDGIEAGRRIYSLLQLSVPFDDHPVAPFGGMFWLRGKSMSALYRHEWSEKDFQDHSMRMDEGSVCDALSRMYPMIAQESRFLSCCVCPSDLAGHQYANMYSNLQKYSAVKIDCGHVHFSAVRKILGLYIKRKILRILCKFFK